MHYLRAKISKIEIFYFRMILIPRNVESFGYIRAQIIICEHIYGVSYNERIHRFIISRIKWKIENDIVGVTVGKKRNFYIHFRYCTNIKIQKKVSGLRAYRQKKIIWFLNYLLKILWSEPVNKFSNSANLPHNIRIVPL